MISRHGIQVKEWTVNGAKHVRPPDPSHSSRPAFELLLPTQEKTHLELYG